MSDMSVITKNSLAVNQITSNIKDSLTKVKKSNSSNKSLLQSALALSQRLDEEESNLNDKRSKINAERFAMQEQDQIMEDDGGYQEGIAAGFESGFSAGIQRGIEIGSKSILDEISKVPGIKDFLSRNRRTGGFQRTGVIGGAIPTAFSPGSYSIDPSKFGDGVYGTGLLTGPEANIGMDPTPDGRNSYHIDTQFSSDLSMEDIVKMVDQLAKGYADRGREMEFSNAAVSGRIYDRNASFEDKSNFLMDAFKAHNLPRGRNLDGRHGFYQMDYYIPEIGKGRGHGSAENAEMLVPTMKGSTMQYGQSPNYGASVNLYTEDGKLYFRQGHGDIRGAKSGTVDISPPDPPDPNNLLVKAIDNTNNKITPMDISEDTDSGTGEIVVVNRTNVVKQSMVNNSGGEVIPVPIPIAVGEQNDFISYIKSIS